MSLTARIFDEEQSPAGQPVEDQPDGFLSVALAHARRSPHRFPLLARVADGGSTDFTEGDRGPLRAEWLMLESLAIGGPERRKWGVLFEALTRHATFNALRFQTN